MSPAEASKILELPPGAPSAQVEERFLALRAQMEEKAARALTPNLAAQYRAAFARTAEAYETLVLAAEGITPVLSVAVPVASAKIKISARRRLVAAGKGLLALVAGSLLVAAVSVLTDDHLLRPPGKLSDFELGLIIWVLVAALPGLVWRWHSLWIDQRRLAGESPAGAKDWMTRPLVLGYLLLGIVSWIFISRGGEEAALEVQWVEKAEQAQRRNDLTGAVKAYAAASAIRPHHEDYARRHEYAQQDWIAALEAQTGKLPAPVAYGLLRGAGRPEFPLTAEASRRYRHLFKATDARIAQEAGDAFTKLVELTGKDKIPEARALLESWRPLARQAPEFDAMEAHLDGIESQAQYGPLWEALGKNGYPATYALLEKMELKDDAMRRRHRVETVKLHMSEWMEVLNQTGELIGKGEFIEAQDKLADLEVMVDRMSRLDGYAETLRRAFEGLEPSAMLTNLRRAWRGELVRRTVVELEEPLAQGDAAQAQAVLEGYSRLQGYEPPVSGEALVKEKFFPQFLDDLAMLNLRTMSPGEPDSLSCLALVQAALPHFDKPERARQFLAEGYHTLAQWGLKNGVPGLALYLQREAGRAGGAADAELEAAALKLFAESNVVRFAFPALESGEGDAAALAAKVREATKAALETGSRGLFVIAEDGSVDEEHPRSFVLRGTFTGIEQQAAQRNERKTARYPTGNRQAENPAYLAKSQQAEKAGKFYYIGRQAVIEARSKLNFATEHGQQEAMFQAQENFSHAESNSAEQKKTWDALLAELRTIPRTVPEVVFAEGPYQQITHHRNQAAAFELKLKNGALPGDGQPLGAWDARFRYSVMEVSGDIQHGIPVQAAAFVSAAEVSQRFAEEFKAKLAAQTPALLWKTAQAVRGAKETWLQRNSNDGRLSGDFEWGWVAFWEKCGVVFPVAVAEASARETLGLPARAALAERPFVPPAGWQVENSLGMRFSAVPGTDVLFSVWETRVQDFAVFVNQTRYVAQPGILILNAQGYVESKNDWRDPGFKQQPTHPVCGVNPADASAFAVWLTAQERAAGLLAKNYQYRLPTKAEWDRAAAASSAVQDNWPALGAGNLAGVELRDADAPADLKIIAGYGDGYSRTAPVGSFSSNHLGIYDLEGNVIEWLKDPMYPKNPTLGRRTAGTGFDSSEPEADTIHGFKTDWAASRVGFRLVIAPVENP